MKSTVELNDHPDADIVYSDEDRIDEKGRASILFQDGLESRVFLAITWSVILASFVTPS